jgi:hypothetical protein
VLEEFVAMVKTTFAAAVPGKTELGAKLHCAPAGIPLQERVTTPENEDPDAPAGATVKLYRPDVCPAVTVCDPLEEAIVKS